jgi:hypothetical protein
MAALSFLWVEARRPGVVERGSRSVEEAFEAAERGRFGVNGAGRVGLSVEDALDDELDILNDELN